MDDNTINIDINGNYDDFRKAADGAILIIKQLEAEEQKWAKWSDEMTKRTKSFLSVQKQKEAALKAEAEAQRRATEELRKSKMSWTDFHSMYTTVLDVVRVGQQIWGATVNELVAYGDQVQRLSTITGQNAEEVSRQIQLADDLRVSYESLYRCLQFASRKGVDTSIEGLVKLGEEYKKLPAGIERTQFLMEKFMRSFPSRPAGGTLSELAAARLAMFAARSGS